VGGQLALPNVLNLVSPYLGCGPDLLEPCPRLRIVPGKLHGEPHFAGTRIASATLFALHEAGYTPEQIQRMYPQTSLEALNEAIDLEQSLHAVAA
jgi:uncharacterized protein (DUF433 family)